MASLHEELIPLLADIDAGAMVLTPNHLTAVQLLDWYGQYRARQNRPAVCPSPAIFPIDIWIRRQCSALLDAADPLLPAVTLLEPAQEPLVWHTLISQSETGTRLLNPGATARAVQEAWTLVHLWRIRLDELQGQAGFRAGNGDADLEAFLQWSAAFEKFCDQKQLRTQVELLEKFIPLVSGQHIVLPETVFLCGFLNPPPLYQALLSAITEAASSTKMELPTHKPSCSLQGFADTNAELETAAIWAREILQAAPEAKLGIIIPDLSGRQAQIQRVFSRILGSDETRSLQRAETTPFAMSASHSLAQVPVINAALQILGRNQRKPDTLETCQFLRSVYLAGAEPEAGARAAIETLLREDNMPHVGNGDLKRLARLEKSAMHAPVLAQNLDAFDEVLRGNSIKNRTTRQWAMVFEQQLAAMGWPGDRQLASTEPDAFASWYELLAAFCKQASIFGNLTLDQAIGLLTRMAEAQSSKQRGNNARLQILTPTQADGLQFSHCRMLGLSEQQWPPAPRPTPFLPYALQKQVGIPDADISAHAGAALAILERLVTHTSTEVVFSYPENAGDISLKPSMMLTQLDVEVTKTTDNNTNPALHPAAVQLMEQAAANDTEILADSNLVPLKPLDNVRGGTALVANQAECPFRSFASHRLAAKPLERLQAGLTPRASGNLVHLALEIFWKQLVSQAQLLALDQAQRQQVVQESVAAAVTETRKKYFHTMTEAFCELEKNRLTELLMQWLDEEAKRGSFDVLASETHTSWQCHDITLSLRIDRIDRTKDGTLVLVDYKTARRTSVGWEDDRPINPQLMLYCMAAEQQQGNPDNKQFAGTKPVAGLYFAQVNIEDTRYSGLAATSGIYPGTSVEELNGKFNGLSESATWASLRQHWQHSIGNIVEEFLNGNTAIVPYRKTSCDHCFVRPVCRIDEVIEQ